MACASCVTESMRRFLNVVLSLRLVEMSPHVSRVGVRPLSTDPLSGGVPKSKYEALAERVGDAVAGSSDPGVRVLETRVVSGLDPVPLPFVNRQKELSETMHLLLNNSERVSRERGSREMSLVFLSQLFGIGKTKFGEKLGKVAQAIYGEGKCHYARFIVSEPGRAVDLEAVFVNLVLNASVAAGLLTGEEAEARRGYDLGSVLDFIRPRLEANEARGGCVSQLFLHLDEFDMANPSFDHLFSVIDSQCKNDSLQPLYRHYRVWNTFLVHLQAEPRIHLLVSGRSPALALLGCGVYRDDFGSKSGWPQGAMSPTASRLVALGTMSVRHIVEILDKIVIVGGKGETVTATRAVGVELSAEDMAGTATREEMRRRMEAAELDVTSGRLIDMGLVDCLHQFTGGVPRFISLTLSWLLKEVYNDRLPALWKLTGAERVALFGPAGGLFADISVSPYMTVPQASLSSALSKEDVKDVVMWAKEQTEFKFPSEEFERAQRLVHMLCLYFDRGSKNDTVKIVVPGLVNHMIRKVGERVFAVEFGKLQPKPAKSAGAFGDDLEAKLEKALGFWICLSTGRAHSLLKDLVRWDVDFEADFEKKEVPKFMRDKSDGKDLTDSSLSKLLPAVLEQAKGRNVLFIPGAQSHSGDLFMSLTLTDGGHALVVVAAKSAVAADVPAAKVLEEVNKFAEMVEAARGMHYPHFLLLLCGYPRSIAVLQTGKGKAKDKARVRVNELQKDWSDKKLDVDVVEVSRATLDALFNYP